ncbi:Rac prophage protein [Salmonella enterica subsp. enterica serovar Heidelberg str. RI-11-014316]|nr:Rac prophage protein [Salmonella enterica subsp. enterica serovar Heidelberg str. RI-11-014316]
MPDNPPTTHEENAARLSQAGKCLRDIEAGRFQCDEEKQQPTGELADEPATPEAVEQDTTEHPPDPQPLENEPPVSQTEAGYQKIRAELHEARKNIPPKNPVDVGKQLAAARGEYVEDISDPNDPRWVHNNYSASNQGEKEEVVPEGKQPAAEPEAVTRNADGTFDVSALFLPPSNQTEKTESQNRKRWRNAEREQPAGNGWRYRTGNYNGRWIRYNFIAQNHTPVALIEKLKGTDSFTVSAWIDRYEVLLQRRNLSVNTYKIRSNQLATVREKIGRNNTGRSNNPAHCQVS